MGPTCPPSYLPPGCWDVTKQAGSNATLTGLLATIAAAAIVLVLQAPKETSFEQEPGARNTALSVLVSTFLSCLLASFVFGLLSGESDSFRADVLLNLASPALVVGVLQFLLSISWLLTWRQAQEKTIAIARMAFLLVIGLVILFLALDWGDLLELKTKGVYSDLVYIGAEVLCALVFGTIVWISTTVVKRRLPIKELERWQKGIDNAHWCSKIGLFFTAGCTLLYGIISNFYSSDLLSSFDIFYYLGVISSMLLMVWFVCICELSWPPPLPPSEHSHNQHKRTSQPAGKVTTG